jgi:hypothetical protein
MLSRPALYHKPSSCRASEGSSLVKTGHKKERTDTGGVLKKGLKGGTNISVIPLPAPWITFAVPLSTAPT